MFSSNRKSAAVGKAKARAAAGLSLIDPALTVSGGLASDGQIHVEGRVDGDVRCVALCQSASGVIAGDIRAEEARIGGLVEGNVTAGTVVIEASGRVTGDVAYDTISIAAGARVEGRLARRRALAGADTTSVPPAAAAADEEHDRIDAGGLFSSRPTPIVAD
ncbi:MAG: polymer-forming cytoskeletal protein [Sphingomonas sp.]